MEPKKKLEDYGIHHVGYVVKDLDETVNHFKKFYGIDDFQIYEFSPSKVWSYGEEVQQYRLKIAMGKLKNTTCGIEIIQPLEGEGVHKDFIVDGNNGMHHICFAVEDYDYWREHFMNAKAEFVFESETEDEINGYRRCFYAEDLKTEMIFEIKEIPHFRK
ncbi:VOC family protein [Clostridiaceae bacterium 35-E11]